MMEKVPFIDLNYQTKLIKKNVLNQWNKILDNSSFVLSEDLKNFDLIIITNISLQGTDC